MTWPLSTPNNFVVYGQKHKVWVLVLLGPEEHVETKFERMRRNFLFCNKTASCTVSSLKMTLLGINDVISFK